MKLTNKQRAEKKLLAEKQLNEPLTEAEFNEIFSTAVLTPEFVEKMPPVKITLIDAPKQPSNMKWWIVSAVVTIGLLLLLL